MNREAKELASREARHRAWMKAYFVQPRRPESHAADCIQYFNCPDARARKQAYDREWLAAAYEANEARWWALQH